MQLYIASLYLDQCVVTSTYIRLNTLWIASISINPNYKNSENACILVYFSDYVFITIIFI